jgi:hypothetical protein
MVVINYMSKYTTITPKYLFSNIYSTIIDISKPFYSLHPLIIFYFSWIAIHYISSQLYVYYCTPQTLTGFFISPLLSISPHCNAIRWIISEAGAIFYGMWISIGSWIVTNVLTRQTV